MSATAISRDTGGSTSSAVRAGAAGLIAGLVFAMWAMIVGIFTSNLWAAPQGIGQALGMVMRATTSRSCPSSSA